MGVIGKGFTVNFLILDTDILDQEEWVQNVYGYNEVFQNWDQCLSLPSQKDTVFPWTKPSRLPMSEFEGHILLLKGKT